MIWFNKKEEGGWIIWIADSEMPELLNLPARLRQLLENPDFTNKILARLFPQAYPDDPEAEIEDQRLVREDLVNRKMEAINRVEDTLKTSKSHSTPEASVKEVHLTNEDLTVWLGFLHDSRLTIGTALDITNDSWERDLDPKSKNFDELLLLNQLSYFEEALLEAIRDSEDIL